MKENKRLPESELDIMLVVWAGGEGVTAPAILEHLERPLTAEETEVLTALLPSGRRARLERIWDAARRQEPLCAYFILRRAVWEQYHWQELPPLALTEKGKPYFPDIPAVHFSISHTDGAVLAALSAAPVGVDVERLRPV